MTGGEPGREGRIGETLRNIDERLPGIQERLDGLQPKVRHLGVGLAILALAVAAVVAAALAWVHHQDDVRAAAEQANAAASTRQERALAAVQAQNTVFRQRICVTLGDWRVYLRNAPAGDAEGRAAAGRLVADLRGLCRE